MKKKGLIVCAVFAVVAIAVLLVHGFFRYKPMNADKVESVYVSIEYILDENVVVTLSQKDSVLRIIDFETQANEYKGVNGLANAVDWRVEIVYSLKNGKISRRFYRGQMHTYELSEILASIPEFQNQDAFPDRYDSNGITRYSASRQLGAV